MLVLIDYGIGNLRSVKKALESVGADVVQSDNPDDILNASKVILPGVGAFHDGMSGLHERGLIKILNDIYHRRIPLLGICLGMQLFFERSPEMGNCQGLGFIKGDVKRFNQRGIKIPQTGWNQLLQLKSSPLLSGINENSYVYFNHSYYCSPTEKQVTMAQTDYGKLYASIIQTGSLYGVQFHPEKSQDVGLKILRNFVELCL